MDEHGGNIADGMNEMVSGNTVNPAEELRKRRSTRIVQAVPLVVTGVDALGRPFTERTSTLIINCHGCRYQSKHYVLKNMWVTLEIPHPEPGRPARAVRGKVAWIQRPRTVRQLFQVALESEVPGNVWGIGFPPEDWFPFPESKARETEIPLQAELPQLTGEGEMHLALTEQDLPPAVGPGTDNLRVFPSPGSTTDAALQLARQVARLLADAKQQIQAATREAATEAIAEERRAAFGDWAQKLSAAREALSSESLQAIDRVKTEANSYSKSAHAAAAEALQDELPKWLAPKLEELTKELTAQIAEAGAAQRAEQEERLAKSVETLDRMLQQTEEATARLREQSEKAQAEIGARSESATRGFEEASRQREESTNSQKEMLGAAAREIQQQVSAGLAEAQTSWHGHLAQELETAQARWQSTLEESLRSAQERTIQGMDEHSRRIFGQLQEEGLRQTNALREMAVAASAGLEQRLAEMREAMESQSRRLDETIGRASESAAKLEKFSERIEIAQREALSGFQVQLDDVLTIHRNELHRRSESLFEELNGRIRTAFERSGHESLARFDEQVRSTVQPHIDNAQEAIHRLAGGRSLLDAALTLQQDRIRASADEAFADSLARFRDNLGSVEQVLHESAQTITARNLTELEGKAGDLKHQTVEEIFKSSEWYEKKAQTQMQNTAEKAAEQFGNHLRERAGEVSGAFASELDHSSRGFIEHTQTQMDEVVRDSFEKARALFAEAADTTSAAFTDEIQRHARQELDGFTGEVQKAVSGARADLESAKQEHAQKITSEQEHFLLKFRENMSGALEGGVAEAHQKVQAGLTPLLESWKSMTAAHQQELEGIYGRLAQESAEQYTNKLENVSNQWMLATVASLDRQSRDVVGSVATSAEEKLREACNHVFANIGEALRERLQEIASTFSIPPVSR